MCGIAGFCDFTKTINHQSLVEMTDVLEHRGPDDKGYSLLENYFANIGLGFRRLSILDLSSHGHQPMSFEQLEIVFNGEVYNFKEIRSELEKYNYNFISNSDTEVILKAFHKWGKDAVHKFNGMFAFSIYDSQANKISIFRDRAGVKPLYWYYKDNLILFASELKSFHKISKFHKEIDRNALALFLKHGYILEPYSIFKYTRKLKAGHYLEIDLGTRNVKEHKYWDVVDFYQKPKLNISETEAIEEVEGLFKSAFNYRMIADVPVGVFLSGGYDSSVVTAILQKDMTEKLKTFTIGYDEKDFDESVPAREISEYLGTEHTELICTQKEALDIIPKLAEIYDEPLGDTSAIPTVLVSQLAKQDVTVSLSADGGDEVFAGYSKYDTAYNYYKKFSRGSKAINSLVAAFMANINPAQIPYFNNTYNFPTRYEKVRKMMLSKNAMEALKYSSMFLTDRDLNRLLKDDFDDLVTNFDIDLDTDSINGMLAVDYKTFMLDYILMKVDRATMSVGLEGREPLLDYRIVEFVAQLPAEMKYKNAVKKWMLKEITHKYLPKEMMNRPKKGFSVPVQEWFKDELKGYFLTYLERNRLEREGFFNVDEVIKLRDNYLAGKKERVNKLWFILIFEMWYERWMA